MDHKLLMDTAVMAGRLMLKSGAETYRVEETINRILEISSQSEPEAFVTPTGIFATLDQGEGQVMTVVKRVPHRAMNLNRIYEVNEVSRALCSGKIRVEEAMERLKAIQKTQYSRLTKVLSTVGVTMGFALLLGGNVWDILTAGVMGVILTLFANFGFRVGMNVFFEDVLAVAAAVSVGILFRRITGLAINIDLVIIGTIMPLVPGAAITNAIRDTLQGDYVSGGARAVEAFIKAFSVALGVSLAILIMSGV